MVLRVAITVKELSRSIEFYTNILNFKLVGRYNLNNPAAGWLFGLTDASQVFGVEVAVMALGDEIIELMEFQNSAPTKGIPVDTASNDLWFQHLAIVVSNIELAWEHLKKFDIESISPSPQRLPKYLQAAGISAYYFNDPDGHVLELIHFPADKGDSKWHTNKAGLFLGIDHTAIVVQNTQNSITYYQNLGFEIKSQTENYGPQQEKLNQVEDSHLLITGLKLGQGMGVEMLDFIKPENGRPIPGTSQPYDLIYWHTVIEVDDLTTTFNWMKAQGSQLVSTKITRLLDWQKNVFEGFIARDYDGHATLILKNRSPLLEP